MQNLIEAFNRSVAFLIAEREDLLQSGTDVRQVALDIRAFFVFTLELLVVVDVRCKHSARFLQRENELVGDLR